MIDPVYTASYVFLHIVERLPVALQNFMSLSALIFTVIVLVRLFRR